MLIRKGTREDIDSVFPLIHEFIEDSLGDYGMTLNPEVAKEAFKKFVDLSFLLFVNGEVAGVLAGQLADNNLSTDNIFQEQIWFVSKKYRRYGIKLLRYVEHWIKNEGYSAIIMGHMENSRTEPLKRYYEKVGYKLLESHYFKRL